MGINPFHPIGIFVVNDHPIFRDAKQKRILMLDSAILSSLRQFHESQARPATLRQSQHECAKFGAGRAILRLGRRTSGEYPFTSHPCAPLSAKEGG